MATKTYQEWFDDVGRKMMCDDAYDRTTYGQALWKAATDAAVEEFTSTNNESMPCICDSCTWERSCCVAKYLPDAITGCRGYIDSRKVTAHVS